MPGAGEDRQKTRTGDLQTERRRRKRPGGAVWFPRRAHANVAQTLTRSAEHLPRVGFPHVQGGDDRFQ